MAVEAARALAISVSGIGPLPGKTTFSSGGTPPSRKNEEQPARVGQELSGERKFLKQSGIQQLFHAVARIALANSADRRVDGKDQAGKTGAAGAIDGSFGRGASAHEIELVKNRAGRAGFHIFEFVARDGGEDVAGAGFSRGARGGDFSAGMHEAAVADGSEHERKRNFVAEHGGAQIAAGMRDGVARAKSDVIEDAAIFAQGDFAFGAAIQIVEHHFGKAALRCASQVADIDHVR